MKQRVARPVTRSAQASPCIGKKVMLRYTLCNRSGSGGVTKERRVGLANLSWNAEDLRSRPDHLRTVDAGYVAVLRNELPSDGASLPRAPGADYLESGAASVLAELASGIRACLQEGPGFAILTGAGLSELTDNQLSHVILGISAALGSPMAQNPAGDLLVSVRDETPQDPQARGYRTNEHLFMHTDAADIAGLLCLHQGMTGGGNYFASAEMVHDTLCEEEADLVPEFYRRWEWDRRGLEPPGAAPTLRSSIFSYYRGQLSCRYAPRLLRDGAARAGGSLSPEQEEAMIRFEEVAARPSLTCFYRLSRGESVWLNNYAVLHAREAFTNDNQAGPPRHLLRSWVWARDGRALAPAFTSPREVY